MKNGRKNEGKKPERIPAEQVERFPSERK
jgi:hypothetical protein